MNNPIKNDELGENTTIDEVVLATETPEQQKSESGDSKLSPIPPAKKENTNRMKEMGKKVPLGPGNFWNNMLTTVLLLIFVTAVFSYITEKQVKPTQISITDVAGQVKAGEVKEIIVRGDILEINYNDTTKAPGEAKREVDAPITGTLNNLGVTAEEIAKIKIDVQRESGFMYWFGRHSSSRSFSLG
jgi:HAMP domain-containing protein